MLEGHCFQLHELFFWHCSIFSLCVLFSISGNKLCLLLGTLLATEYWLFGFDKSVVWEALNKNSRLKPKKYYRYSIFSLTAGNYLHFPKSLFFKEAIIRPYTFENGTNKWSSFTQGMGQAHNELCLSSWNSIIEFDLNFLDGNFSM